MELSILIPTYNFNSTPLVKSLVEQAEQINDLVFEIICLDDGSTEEYKTLLKPIDSLPNCSFTPLPSNVGRSKIRNLLTSKANYENLLFLDCDSKVPDQHFVANYINYQGDFDVIYGGRTYEQEVPDSKYLFRWTYGREREEISESVRSKSPYKSLMTNNYLIKKTVAIETPFDESIVGYGHEDTKFSEDLKSANKTITHIANPIHHVGLETAQQFLAKSKTGVLNLAALMDRKAENKSLKLVVTYRKLEATYMCGLVGSILGIFHSTFEKNLTGPTPNLLYFDLLKLYWLIKRPR